MVGVEVGGRIGEESVELVDQLAWHRAAAALAHMRGPAKIAFAKRWVRLFGCAAARAAAATLAYTLEELKTLAMPVTTTAPWLADTLADARRELELASGTG